MIDFATASFDALLAKEGQPCACGMRHQTELRILKIGKGVLSALPEVLASLGKKRPYVVCDANTYKAAGEKAVALLKAAGVSYGLFQFPPSEEKMEPDEWAVGSLTMAFDPASDIVVAIGSGVINDCCKVLAHAAGIPSMVVGTAPSMDGYASNSSSMIQNRIKTTIYNACPVAIIADTDILREAPMRMLWAGLGDMLAKYTALCEWRISEVVTGEPYCENVARLVRTSLAKCVSAADGLILRDADAVEAVVTGLVLSGIAMSYARCSRPASGLDHYFSHLWEMMALERGEASDLHGIQVAVGTVLTLRALDRLRASVPDRAHAEAAMAQFDQARWEAEMRDIFGKTASQVIDAEKTRYHKNDPAGHKERLNRILAHWGQFQAVMEEELPNTDEIIAMMRRLGMPVEPMDLGIGREEVRKAFIGSREIRDKYLTSSLLWDLGALRDYIPVVAP